MTWPAVGAGPAVLVVVPAPIPARLVGPIGPDSALHVTSAVAAASASGPLLSAPHGTCKFGRDSCLDVEWNMDMHDASANLEHRNTGTPGTSTP